MMERNISSSVQSAMRLSASMANADNHTSYGISHLVLALLSEGTGSRTYAFKKYHKIANH